MQLEILAFRETLPKSIFGSKKPSISRIWRFGVVPAKLKEKLIIIKLKATNYAASEIKLLDKVKFLAAKLKSAGGASMLTADAEYVNLVGKHHLKDSLRE